MRLEDRLRRAGDAPVAEVDLPSIQRDLHVVLRRGRRRRRARLVVVASATVLALLAVLLVGPQALDAIRGGGRPRPAVPDGIEGEPGVITTVVGNGDHGPIADGGLAVDSAIQYPFDLVEDADGSLYVLEHGRIRRVDTSGRITTVAGGQQVPSATELTEARRLDFRGANALAIDRAGNLYVGGGEGKHFMVNRISPAGEVTRIAGTGRQGFAGDGGPAVEAELGWIYDLDVDAFGNVYLADYDNHRIRMVDTAGIITTIAGTGVPGVTGDGGPATEARLEAPTGIFVDALGNVYFTQSRNDVIRRIDPNGVITTIAGNGQRGYRGDGGPATEARFSAPEHVAVDGEGVVYVEDTGNHVIRRIDVNGIVTTIVGMPGGSGFEGDGGPATEARLYDPSGMLLTPAGVLYIADSGNNRIRRVIL
jgi:sugar lactone lactonase YvrE